MDTESATESIYFRDSRVDSKHLIIHNTHSIISRSWFYAEVPTMDRSTHFVWFLTHCCRAFIGPRNLCNSSLPGTLPLPVTPSHLAPSFHNPVIKQVLRYCSSQTSSEHRHSRADHVGECLEMHSNVVVQQVWRCTLRPPSSEIAGIHRGGRSRAVTLVIG